jgi:hypothetical protein
VFVESESPDPVLSGSGLFSLYFYFTELAETKMPSLEKIYLVCFVWDGRFSKEVGA